MRPVGSVFGMTVLGNIVTSHFKDKLATGLQALRLPAQVVAKILAMAGEGRESAAGSAPARVDMAAVQKLVAQSFTSGIHVALWVSGIMLLATAPVAYALIRYTAPHLQTVGAPPPPTAGLDEADAAIERVGATVSD